MSFIVPGQGQKKDEAVGTRAGAKPNDPGPIASEPVEEPPAVEFAGWAPELQQVVENEFRRTSAFAGYRWKTADDALVKVVRGLDDLLDLAADSLQDAAPKRSRNAPAETDELSFDEVADLLGIPADELAEAIDDAGRPVRRSRADRRTAQRAIKQLRTQLQQTEVTMDHTRLGRLISIIVRVVLGLGTAVGSRSASELVEGEDDVDTVIQTAVVALTAFALERTTAAHQDTWQERKPATTAARAHKDLLESVAEAKPTDDTAQTFRLLVRSARAWVACFQLDRTFAEKLEYWQALDELSDAIRSAADLQSLHHRLEALTPPQ